MIEVLDVKALERPAGHRARVYEEQRRQARWAFNICCVFAAVGATQAVAGLVAVFLPDVARWAIGALLGGGGIFGVLSRWAGQISESANLRMQRIADDEQARELIREIADQAARDAAIGRLLQTIGERERGVGRVGDV